MFYRIKIILIVLGLIQLNKVFAQEKLDSGIFVNTSQYKPTIADANKLNENPVIIDSTKKLKVTGYGINSQKIKTNFDVNPITPAQMLGEPLTKLYNSYVKIGMGTYTTPYGELWVNNLRSKEYNAGFRAKHLSSSYTPKNYGYGGYNNDEISIYGKKFLKKHSLSGSADYNRNTVHLYGYDINKYSLNRGNTELRYNYLTANAQLKSHYSDPKQINHDIKISGYTLMDRFNTFENNAKITGGIQTEIYKELFNVNALVDYYNYKTKIDTVNNTIITLSPSFIANDSNYHAIIGINATTDIFNKSKYYFYPNLYISYNVFDNIIIPFAGLNGGLQKNSYKSFTDENPFVLSHLLMQNSNKTYEAFGGLKGSLSSTTSFMVKVSQQNLNNMPLYVNDTNGYQNQFDVIYDDAKILNLHGEAGYQLREKIKINLTGDYYDYKMKTQLKAWYKPQVKVALSGNYNLKNKIVAKIDVFYLSNQYSRGFESDTTSSTGIKVIAKELKGIVDVNIGAEYRYSKRLGFFLQFNNIANFRYYRYSNYPTQKFNLMGGLSFSF